MKIKFGEKETQLLLAELEEKKEGVKKKGVEVSEMQAKCMQSESQISLLSEQLVSMKA